MKPLLRALAVAGPLAVAGAAADAATFNLANQTRSSTPSFSLTVEGLTMTVTGESPTGDTVRTDNNYGLSVGDHLIDGHEGSEYAIFSFSEAVTVKSFYAGYVDRYDDWTLWAYNGGWSQIDMGDFGVGNYNGYNSNRTTVTFTGAAATTVASMFAIGTYDRWDDFKIRDVTVERVSEVPLPATGLLLLGALGALGLRRRKA